jgi:heme-binding NEAT domain protein
LTEEEVKVCVPAALKVNPFQIRGNSFSQIVESKEDENTGRTVKFNVTILSQPFIEFKVIVGLEVDEKLNPFHKYGVSLEQIEIVSVSL